MSILIKGMEMPKEKSVIIQVYPDGTVRRLNGSVFKSHFAAVPIPVHGRLIDADKVRESVRIQAGFLKLVGGKMAEIVEPLEKGFLQEIDNAPTIIPAEEEET